jgi:hypothetical protein
MCRRIFRGVVGIPDEVWVRDGGVSDRLDYSRACRAIYTGVEEECSSFGSGADAVDRSFGYDGRFEAWVLFCMGKTTEEGRENGAAMGWTYLERLRCCNNGCSGRIQDGSYGAIFIYLIKLS